MPLKLPMPYLDPNMDLPAALQAVDQTQAQQSAATQGFGQSQDSNIQNIYNQLGGDLAGGTKNIQSIYGQAAQNVQAAGERAGLGGQAAAASTIGGIGNFASRLGMDQNATAEVQGRLADRAQSFDLRNREASTARQGNLQQLGAAMASVSQLGQQAAQMAAAQGRSDLSRRITTELQRIATNASSAKTAFTANRAQQMARATAESQTKILQAQKELMSEQRASARSAASDARSQRSSDRADARASRAEARAAARGGGMSWMDKFQLTNAENDRRDNRTQSRIAPNPHDVVWNDYMDQNFGPKATAYIEDRLRDDPKRKPKLTSGMNKDLLETYVRRRQSIKEK